MKYCIDYRPGSMGATILAHALFACNKIDFDLDTFFSDSGHAHRIFSMNQTNLVSQHLQEFPNPEFECVIEVMYDGWWQVLATKMLYSKHVNEYPGIENIEKFFPLSMKNDSNEKKRLWQEFYSAYRDPSWPECDSEEHIQLLPVHIQDEIRQVYISLDTWDHIDSIKFLEVVSLGYYNMFTIKPIKFFKTSKILLLEHVFQNKIDVLIDMCTALLGWNWDYDKSKKFHSCMLAVNAQHLDWLIKIQNEVNQTIETKILNFNLELWEQAIVLAKVCEFSNMHPKSLNWDNSGRLLDNITVS